MNYFEYNGIRSTDLGVRIQSKNIYSSPKFDLSFIAVPGRDGELLSSNHRYPNTEVSYTCFVAAKTIQELSDKLTAIKGWLYAEPDAYHPLTDSYEPGFVRKAIFNNKLDITDQCRKLGVFTVHFSCYPYRYLLSGQSVQTFSASSFTLTNPYPFQAKPYIKINGSGSGTLTIQSGSSNKIWRFSTLNGYTECDSELMNFYHGTTLKNDTVEGDGFPIFYNGVNTITFSGGITSIEIIPRWRTL